MNKKPRRGVNSTDVAAMAQVSRSAVSRTFTPGASVAPDTRERVLAAAKTLGYRPNKLARGLMNRQTRLVAIIMANLDSPFFTVFLTRLNLGLEAQGYSMLLLIVPGEGEVDRAVAQALDYHVEGVILISALPSPSAVSSAEGLGVPLVVLDRRTGERGASFVWIDAPAVGIKVADLMWAEGRRRPAVVGVSRAPPARELTAFMERMEQLGAACRWIPAGLTYADAQIAAETLFSGGDAPDAVFAGTDIQAIGVYDAARDRYGLRVPRDLSIMGVGDTPASDWSSHRISTVRLPIAALVQVAIATLLAQITDPTEAPPRIWLDCDLVERGTTLGLAQGGA